MEEKGHGGKEEKRGKWREQERNVQEKGRNWKSSHEIKWSCLYCNTDTSWLLNELHGVTTKWNPY